MSPDQRRHHRIAEAEAVRELRSLYPARASAPQAGKLALALAERVRSTPPPPLSAESFLRHYGLSNARRRRADVRGRKRCCASGSWHRGCAAARKLGSGAWGERENDSWFANAADWALLLTGKLARWHDAPPEDLNRI